MNQQLTLLWHYLLPKRLLNEFAGLLANSRIFRLKNYLINYFIKRHPVNMDEALESDPFAYESFNAFFTRRLKASVRPLGSSTYLCPADGFVSQAGRLKNGQLIQAKGMHYELSKLIADDKLAEDFSDGSFITIYLSPTDYHRLHMPIDAVLVKQVYIPGRLFSVQPFTTNHIPGLFAKNERLVLHFKTAKGPFILVMVGATIVGHMGTSWSGDIKRQHDIHQVDYQHQDIHLQQGDEFGYFKLGSTVIMLTPEAIDWKMPIDSGSPCRMGQDMADDNNSASTH
jgi:phosphatidylserine decarboxylase